MPESNPLRVGVLFGGRSGEHEVSLNSARNVMEALRQAGHMVVPIGITPAGRWLTEGDPMACLTAAAHPLDSHAAEAALRGEDAWALLPHPSVGGQLAAIDIIFPVLHGPYGEDGAVQGLLEMANLAYVGCGVLASAAGMDKVVAKQLFAQAGLPQVRYQAVLRRRWLHESAAILDAVEEDLGYPLFVKPANLGSSVGISKARTRAELAQGIDLACQFDRKIVIDQAVPNAREIEVSVLGNDNPMASVPGEIRPSREFYDYAAKYLDDASQLIIPADLPPEIVFQLQEMAVLAFKVIDGAGLARVDFLVDGTSGDIYLNEINTMPGFTRISMYPKLWEASGISYPELVDRLLHLGLERYADRQQNRTARV